MDALPVLPWEAESRLEILELPGRQAVDWRVELMVLLPGLLQVAAELPYRLDWEPPSWLKSNLASLERNEVQLLRCNGLK